MEAAVVLGVVFRGDVDVVVTGVVVVVSSTGDVDVVVVPSVAVVVVAVSSPHAVSKTPKKASRNRLRITPMKRSPPAFGFMPITDRR